MQNYSPSPFGERGVSPFAYWLGLTLKSFLKTSRKYFPSQKPVLSATSVTEDVYKRQRLQGFRINRVDGNKLYPAGEVPRIKPRTRLYRNFDQEFEMCIRDSSSPGSSSAVRVPWQQAARSIVSFPVSCAGRRVASG